jgi:hypothetical protein
MTPPPPNISAYCNSVRKRSIATHRIVMALTLILSACAITTTTAQSATPPKGGTPVIVPMPPPVPGCYSYNPHPAERHANPWMRDKCLTPEQISRFPHLGPASSQFGPPTPCVGTCAAAPSQPPRITMGSVSVSFFSSTAFNQSTYPLFQIIDSCISQQCQNIEQTGTGRFSFSVQANTNGYPIVCNQPLAAQNNLTCVNKDQGWVQFSYAWDIGGYCFLCNGAQSALCIGLVDLSVANPESASSNGFQLACAGPPDIGFNPSFDWWSSPGQAITLTALHSTSPDNQPMLTLIGCFPWAVPQGAATCFTSIVVPDVTGLCPDPATNCQWTEITGSLYGYGNASTAVFPPGTTMTTEVAATACVPIPPYALGFTPAPSFTDLGIFPVLFFGLTLPPFGGPPCTGSFTTYIPPPYNTGWTQNASLTPDAAGVTGTTGETNNLNPPQCATCKPQPPIDPACFAGSCWIDYTSTN